MMKKYTLAVNAGSSSLKCRLFQNDGSEESGGPKEISVIKVTGLNSENVEFGFDPEPKNVPKPEKTSNHEEVFRYILQQVGIDRQTGDSRNPADLVVAHRVVHGGAFENHLEINQETYHELQNLKSLAPL
jgi:acetate kinase